MAVRSYDDIERPESEPLRIVESIAEPIRSIFDLGSEPVGSQPEPDSAATGDAGEGDRTGDAPFDPATVTPGSDRDAPFGRFPDGRPRKRRAKGTGGSNSGGRAAAPGTSRKTEAEVSTFLAHILLGVHEIGANLFKAEELSLDEEEAGVLGQATLKVWQEYDMPIPDAKTMAWVNLAKVVSQVYGPRVMAIRMRKANEARNRPQPIRQVV